MLNPGAKAGDCSPSPSFTDISTHQPTSDISVQRTPSGIYFKNVLLGKRFGNKPDGSSRECPYIPWFTSHTRTNEA
jgi:hypothetical protein